MMLDQECRVIAERLGLDIVVDELPVALAGIDVRPAMAGGRAAEKTKAHHRLLRCCANVAHLECLTSVGRHSWAAAPNE